MKRITPEEVIEAYKQTGIKPMRDNYFEVFSDGCVACAISALYQASGKKIDLNTDTSEIDDFASIYTGSTLYVRGFMTGYDGWDTSSRSEVFRQGFEDGKLVWEAVSKEFD